MEPKIVKKPAFRVVGMQHRGTIANDELPALWQALGRRWDDIQGVADDEYAYGLTVDMNMETREFEYVAGLAVEETADVPEGMVSVDVPGQTYASFTCTLPTLQAAYEQFYGEWLPSSGYRRAYGPELELYREGFEPDDETKQQMEVCVPIVEA
jgi:AraC family transcriptional regulator